MRAVVLVQDLARIVAQIAATEDPIKLPKLHKLKAGLKSKIAWLVKLIRANGGKVSSTSGAKSGKKGSKKGGKKMSAKKGKKGSKKGKKSVKRAALKRKVAGLKSRIAALKQQLKVRS